MSKSQPFSSPNFIALFGHDQVSCFDSQPQNGTQDYRVESMGLQWLLVSQRHTGQFRDAKHKFDPQYGGHCSLAISLNEITPGSPKMIHSIDTNSLVAIFHTLVRERR